MWASGSADWSRPPERTACAEIPPGPRNLTIPRGKTGGLGGGGGDVITGALEMDALKEKHTQKSPIAQKLCQPMNVQSVTSCDPNKSTWG